MKNLISNYASVNVGLEINLETKSAFGRNLRGKSIYAKPIFNYRFSSVDQMMAWLDKDLARRLEIKAHEVARREEKKRALENNPYCVGDVMYDSWGYDQTNIDFYQVIEVKNKSVVLQPINGKMIPSEGYSSMAGLTAPVKNSFYGKPIRKNVSAWVSNGNPSYYLKSSHGIINKYENEERGVYCSWYA
jgi:hypothetical protein